jgi:predicted component of type VI protein secretion system
VAKLTLSFKGRRLKVFALPPGDCTIGRDAGCTFVIDSLAVAPEHAIIRHQDGAYHIEPSRPDCELHVQQRPVGDARLLGEGDIIDIGKHTLVFSVDQEPAAVSVSATPLPSPGWMQIQNGGHLGRTIRLNRAFTRIGRPQGELAMITRRDDGYYLSALRGEQGPLLNEQSIGGGSRKLADLDRIAIGELQVQFFADEHRVSGAPPAGQADTQQRRFSRIPLDHSATLRDDQQHWDTRLLDISLQGALVETPATFVAVPAQRYVLSVHLDGGPDITMEVAVAHQEDDKLGLDCKDIDVESITHLRRLVELNLGDPALLERELSALG